MRRGPRSGGSPSRPAEAHYPHRPRILSSSLGLSGNGNPYVQALVQEMAALGAEIHPFDMRNVLAARADAVLVHWPEYALKAPRVNDAVKGLVRTLIKLFIARLRGVVVIWTVHNLAAHGGRHPRLEPIFWALFIPLVTGHISLTEPGRELALRRFPKLRSKMGAVILHPDYCALIPHRPSKEAARRELGITAGAFVFGLAGRLDSYKGPEDLVRAFLGIEELSAQLLIAGEPVSSELEQRLRDVARQDARIHLKLQPLDDELFITVLAALDLAVLPYRQILNSGTALFALSLGRPILVPEMGGLIALRTRVGPDWVRTFKPGKLDGSVLFEAAEWAHSAAGLPAFPARAWQVAAAETLAFIDAVSGSR